ncbi:carbohydrate ABC transporter permease [Paenibacillus campinasensis]|uniref:ABC transporter permease subunit n=2 Tax=Paenibacillus TaxID=44249 RepID=A0A268F3K1_9BACL|nr:ABC transporter permease subunit [Paenibacillus campinasensis]PAD79949.1 glycerol-3-phosphate ABC transporter permease [Paenibacillus campinasensis]
MEKEFTLSPPSTPITPPANEMESARERKRTSIRKIRRREITLAYACLAPSLLLFGAFLFYPLLKSVYLSLFLTDPQGRVAEFVGFGNFKDILSSDMFYKSFGNTLMFMLLTVPTGIAAALFFAALTHNKLTGMKIFRFIFSLPMAVSVGTGSMIWMILYHPTLGMLNYMLSLAGLGPVQWLTDPKWAMISIAIMTVWMNLGFNYILMLSGIQGVSEDIYDSARIDGSGPLRTFFRITMPLISPTLFFTLVVSIIGAFQAFGQINILTKGGPMNSTNVIVYNIYQDAFINFRFGIGSAQALILFVIILTLTLLQFKFVERRVHYQ